MASDSWTRNDPYVGSISSAQTKNDVSLELLSAEAAHGDADHYNPFSFSPVSVSRLSSGNSFQNCNRLWSPAIHDLNLMTNAVEFSNFPVDLVQDTINRSDASFLDYQVPTSPHTVLNGITTSGSQNQTPSDMITANRNLNREPQFSSAVDAMRDRSFSSASSNEVRNVDMIGLEENTKSNSRQSMDINRAFTNCSAIVSEIPQKLDNVQTLEDKQVRSNALEFDCANKLDGNFLSLGYDSHSSFDLQSNACGRNASSLTDFSFTPHGQVANFPLHNLESNLSQFQSNVGSLVSPNYGSDLNTGHNVWQAATSGFRCSNIPLLPVGEMNMKHFIPTPGSKSSGFGNEMDSRFSSSKTSEGCSNPVILPDVFGNRLHLPEPVLSGMDRLPFNSSVLRDNHQNVSDQIEYPNSGPNLVLPPFGGFTGEPGKKDQSGFARGSTSTSAAQADGGDVVYSSHLVHPARAKVKSLPEAGKGHGFASGVSQSTNQEASIKVKGELTHPATGFSRESIKRRLHLSPSSPTQDQRRKITQTSASPFSSQLLQNALGQIGKSVPAFINCSNPSLVPTAVLRGTAGSCPSRNQTPFPAAPRAVQAPSTARNLMHHTSSSAYQNTLLTIPSATISSPASLSSISSSQVVADEGRSLFWSPPNTGSAMARASSTLSGSSTTPVTFNSSKRVASETLSPLPPIPAPASLSRRTLLSRQSSSLTAPAISSLRRSLPKLAALAKASPALRVSRGPVSMPHIKWKGSETAHLTGIKCLLCKRDVSYAPEGAVSIPSISPTVAVLPCGHAFHDHCLLLITPAEQSKDPPCIPCAIGEK